VAPLKRVRGRGKAIAEMARIFVDGSQDGPGLHIGVAHADAPDDCERLAGLVRAARPQGSVDMVMTLGPVIGTHGGPGTLGLFWFQDESG
jgi:fatty acid-binding protein DegV